MSIEGLLHMVVPPAATMAIISVSLAAAICLLPLAVLIGCGLTGSIARAMSSPLRFALSRLPESEWSTHVAQPVVAVIFFCFFTSRISEDHRILAFFLLIALILAAVWIVRYLRARYRPYFPTILFDERFVYPIWDWLSSQRRLLALLGRVAPLRPLATSLRLATERVHHRRWQMFLGTLFAFSFYTLPVQLFPYLDHWLQHKVPAAVERIDLQWIVESPWVGKSFHIVGMIYLYLFDWVVTVAAIYAIVVFLSPLEPRNMFDNIGNALRDFVRGRKIFLFAGFFWQHGGVLSNSTICARDQEQGSTFASIARAIHDETLCLDRDMRGTWQGINCRVAAVYRSAPASDTGQQNSYCFHYRRLGRSSFIVAVDAKAEGFGGSNVKSQSSFRQLSESIGYLVNVRDSLR